jgi:hypothetical protein
MKLPIKRTTAANRFNACKPVESFEPLLVQDELFSKSGMSAKPSGANSAGFELALDTDADGSPTRTTLFATIGASLRRGFDPQQAARDSVDAVVTYAKVLHEKLQEQGMDVDQEFSLNLASQAYNTERQLNAQEESECRKYMFKDHQNQEDRAIRERHHKENIKTASQDTDWLPKLQAARDKALSSIWHSALHGIYGLLAASCFKITQSLKGLTMTLILSNLSNEVSDCPRQQQQQAHVDHMCFALELLILSFLSLAFYRCANRVSRPRHHHPRSPTSQALPPCMLATLLVPSIVPCEYAGGLD